MCSTCDAAGWAQLCLFLCVRVVSCGTLRFNSMLILDGLATIAYYDLNSKSVHVTRALNGE